MLPYIQINERIRYAHIFPKIRVIKLNGCVQGLNLDSNDHLTNINDALPHKVQQKAQLLVVLDNADFMFNISVFD